MTEYADVPSEILRSLRSVCLGLPEAYQEQAWAGTRWRIRKRTFAHVLTVEAGSPPAYARATAATAEPVTVLMFRSSGPELDALRNAGHPFFAPRWRGDEIGMVLDDDVDWDEVGELVTDSYCIQAPKKLVALVERPTD